jgi:hypothetical protein
MDSETHPDLFEDKILERKKSSFTTKPYNFFPICIAIIIAIPIICWGQGLLIHLDKPRIYISADLFMYGVAIVLFLYWLVYRFAKKTFLNLRLTWIHVSITLFIILFFIMTHVWYPKFLETDKLKAFFLKAILNNRTRDIKLVSIFGIIFLIGQLAFLINLFTGISKKRNGT